MNIEDECDLFNFGFKNKYELFGAKYMEYFKNEYADDLNNHKEKNIDLIISDIEKFMKNRIKSCKNHTKILDEVEYLYKKFKEMSVKYHSTKKDREILFKNKTKIEKVISIPLEPSNAYQCHEEKKFNSEISNFVEEKEFKSQDQGDYLYLDKNDATFLINYLEKEQEFSEQENLIKIQKLLQQISYFTDKFSKQVNNASPMLIQINENYIDSIDKIKQTNEELRKAALCKNQTNKLNYSLIGGLAGTIVPGIGNLIGISLGYLIAKLEERGIKRIEPEKNKK